MDGDVMSGAFWLDGAELVFAEFEGKAVLCEDGCLYVLEDEDALKFNCTAKPAASDGTAAEEPAAGYACDDTFRLDIRADYFTHETVERRKIEQEKKEA